MASKVVALAKDFKGGVEFDSEKCAVDHYRKLIDDSLARNVPLMERVRIRFGNFTELAFWNNLKPKSWRKMP